MCKWVSMYCLTSLHDLLHDFTCTDIFTHSIRCIVYVLLADHGNLMSHSSVHMGDLLCQNGHWFWTSWWSGDDVAVTATHDRDVSIAARYSLAFHFAYGNLVVVMVMTDRCCLLFTTGSCFCPRALCRAGWYRWIADDWWLLLPIAVDVSLLYVHCHYYCHHYNSGSTTCICGYCSS
jgi:hypothetical protein